MAGRQREWGGAGLLFGLCAFGLWSCGGGDAARGSEGNLDDDMVESLPDGALTATWQELGVPGATHRPDLAVTPTGYLALSRRSLGDSKVPSGWESYLYRSTDGVGWQRVEVSGANDNLWLRGVAYGAGHYVLAGMRFGGGGGGVVFHSTDGERWDEIRVANLGPSGLQDVVFAGFRFFVFSTPRTLLSSTDGTTWTTVDLGTTVQPRDVTFGNGQYLLVGSGDLQRSTDGLNWVPTELDCAIPGACITDPSGNVGQGMHDDVVFATGSFFIDEATSTDGLTWHPLPGLYPRASVDGHVLGSTTTDELAIWKPNEDRIQLTSIRYIETLSDSDRATRMLWNGAVEPAESSPENFPDDLPLPKQVEFTIPSGEDCTMSACYIVGNRLYLVSKAP